MTEMKLTKDNFNQVISSDTPVLVDFYADWCGPCRMLSPVIHELAEELQGKVTVGKVNVDEQMELAAKFGISSIPSLLVFRNGQVVNRSLGFVPKQNILKMLSA